MNLNYKKLIYSQFNIFLCNLELHLHLIKNRRRLINKGILISNETQKLGTSHLSQNRHIDEVKEFLAVHTELKRIMRIRI